MLSAITLYKRFFFGNRPKLE